MLNNKKGLSGIILTIIMIGLVLVAVGIVWAVILNILGGQEASIEVSLKCVGIIIEPTSVSCVASGDEYDCSIVVERALGSAGEPVDGVGLTLSNDENSLEEEFFPGNVAATKTITTTVTIDATKADVRIYFIQAGEEKFCSAIN